ncbi:predicted protein [Uncinocarpus reesii 1704]|uniref:Uncharacterized protein n=1 Tax=Uncinocarpus reesii (strain UAMH 1704) TaxID=336963 RepID=C4JJG1_UNCRE|nr:uncharacterized protein UREG_01768 [Uncinocarpus reesii 1704]EEP76919.1 predicted protein [Uncinocarpus reesii 1704]
MCLYHRIFYTCNHSNYTLAYNCYHVLFQLQRINNPWERSRFDIPFELNPNCNPSQRNVIAPRYSEHPCDVCVQRDQERMFFEGANCFFVGTGGRT